MCILQGNILGVFEAWVLIIFKYLEVLPEVREEVRAVMFSVS